jgi:hypothetical protein
MAKGWAMVIENNQEKSKMQAAAKSSRGRKLEFNVGIASGRSRWPTYSRQRLPRIFHAQNHTAVRKSARPTYTGMAWPRRLTQTVGYERRLRPAYQRFPAGIGQVIDPTTSPVKPATDVAQEYLRSAGASRFQITRALWTVSKCNGARQRFLPIGGHDRGT